MPTSPEAIDTWVDHDGARLRVTTRGAGPATLCLHAGIADRRMWSTLDPAAWGRVVAWDRRGFGETTCDGRPSSPIADALAVADALGLDRATWMGCSQGARIALDVALARPDRVGHLILVAPAVTGAPGEDEGLDPALIARYATAEAGPPDALVAFETWFWLDGIDAPEGRVGDPARALVAAMNRDHLARPDPGPLAWPESAWARLEQVAAPVTLVWGGRDLPTLIARFEAMARRLPRARAVVLPGAAHLPSVEDPAGFTGAVFG